MTNTEIVEENIKLIEDCVNYQFARVKDKQFKEDLLHDLVIELIGYSKLQKVHEEGHLNALVTRMIRNNIYSSTSWYYRRYIRPDRQGDEITEREKNIPDES